MSDPELIFSPLCQTIEVEGESIRIEIYKMTTDTGWTLEAENEAGTSVVWDELYVTDFLAKNTAVETFRTEGLAPFKDEDEGKASDFDANEKFEPPRDNLPEDLLNLERFLISDSVSEDAMMLSELDGFLAAIVLSKDLIKPSQWIPVIWGEGEPVFETMEQAQEITSAIMGLYNSILTSLSSDDYGPIFDVDTRNNETIWGPWIEGFVTGMGLWPRAPKIKDGSELHQCFGVIERLHDLFTLLPSDLEESELDDEMRDMAPDLIVHSVYKIYETTGPKQKPLTAANQNTPKVGRNDPCPCGSGKKFKKCCLH